MAKITAAALRTELAHFTGTIDYHRHSLNRMVVYTDGVRHFAEKAGAYWLLDIFATELPGHAKREEFLSIKVTVGEDSRAELLADDGNSRVVWRKAIDYTDCPEGEWRFYFTTGGPAGTLCLLLTTEY